MKTKNMISSKLIALAGLITMCVTLIEAAIPGGSNTYLPPKNGYVYTTPDKPFSLPSQPTRRPGTTPHRPGSSSLSSPYRPSGPTSRPTQPTHGGGEHEHHHHEPGMPFDFQYSVNDVETANDYSHKAVSDGDVTRGEYRVQLPDGRTQIVRYTADWKNGFNAEVTYEGTARYPEGPSAYRPPGGGGGGGGRRPSQGYKY